MKSERRHQLKINTLDQALASLPNKGRRAAVQSVGVALAIVLVGLLVRYRIITAQDRAARDADNLAMVREDIDQIKTLLARGAFDPGEMVQMYGDANSRLDIILADVGSGNPKMAAEAMAARGDAAWLMSNVAATTTRPTEGLGSAENLMGAAAAAYQQVVSSYPGEEFWVNTARFGLGAIAENRRDWAEARKEYQAIADDPKAGELLQGQAKLMAGSVDRVEHPPVIGETTPATQSTRSTQSTR